MYCKNCGQKTEVGSNYCPYCGTKLGDVDSNNNPPSNEKTNTNEEANLPEPSKIVWLWLWIGLHLFSLLMSYTGVKIFNRLGVRNTNEFWPFVEFHHVVEYYNDGKNERQVDFNGYFNNYDWTEFSFYVGFALFLYFLSRYFPETKASDDSDLERATRKEELIKQYQKNLDK